MTPLPFVVHRSQLSEDQSAQFILDSYLMHRKDTFCNHCRSSQTISEVFEVQIHPTRRIRRLVPALTIREGFSMGLATLQVRTQPACFLCIDTFPQEPAAPRMTEDEWRKTLQRKYIPNAVAVPTTHEKGPRLEDL